MEKKITTLLLGLLLVFGLGFTSCNEDDDIKDYDYSVSDLPKSAQEFLTEYFSYTVVSKCQEINDDGQILYQVWFADGSTVVFNTEGVWQEVSAPDGKSIPSGIAPEEIVKYLDTYYSDYGINEINKTGFGYNVEITTGEGNPNLDLMFGPTGDFIGVEDSEMDGM